MEKSVHDEAGSNPRYHTNVTRGCRGHIPFDHRSFIVSLSNCNIPPPFEDLTNFASATPSSVPRCSVFKVLKLRHSKAYVSVKHIQLSGNRWDIGKMKSRSNGIVN